MSDTNQAELKKLMETLTEQGIYISADLDNNLDEAENRYDDVHDSTNVVEEIFDAVIFDLDDYTTAEEQKKKDKKKDKKERRKENSWKRAFN